LKEIEKLLLGGEAAIEFLNLRLDAKTTKTKEDIRRDYAAGILARSDALRLLGYSETIYSKEKV
jgi:hypothetical protein